MKEQEYKDRLSQLEKDFQLNKVNLAKEYANANNPYKKDDIIKDHLGSGKIMSWKIYTPFGYNKFPCLQYVCSNLTKKGEINKREPIRIIYQGNIEV